MFLWTALVAGFVFSVEATVRPPIAPPPGRNRTTSEKDYQTQWAAFLKMEEKTYLTQKIHDERYEIFKDNVDKINRHNSLGLQWTLGVTSFADLTAQEFKEQVVGGCVLGERENEDNVVPFNDTSSNPTSVDWSRGYTTPVKNQGQCGSCWAFSVTGAVESRYAIFHGSLTSLSEQELVDCGGSYGNNGCRGGLMDNGFAYVRDHRGLCSEASVPYRATESDRSCNSETSRCARYDGVTGYGDVKRYSTPQMEAAVAQGPVSVAVEADQSGWQLYKSGVFYGYCGSQLDHGVLAVGYSNLGQSHYWKVKNSWGTNWGEQGYIRLCKDCNANNGRGQCGILGQGSYPTV